MGCACAGQLDQKARSQREARLLHTIKALQVALHRAAHQAAGGPSNLKYMQARAPEPPARSFDASRTFWTWQPQGRARACLLLPARLTHRQCSASFS